MQTYLKNYTLIVLNPEGGSGQHMTWQIKAYSHAGALKEAIAAERITDASAGRTALVTDGLYTSEFVIETASVTFREA